MGCLYMVLKDRGLEGLGDKRRWVDTISGRKVDVEDFDEVVDILKGV